MPGAHLQTSFSEYTSAAPTRRVYVWLLACFLCFTTVTASAQFSNGIIDDTNITPVPGTGHNYIHELAETVNPANGSLSIRIAAPAPHERGLNFPIWVFAFDSSGIYQLAPIYHPWPEVDGTYQPGLELVSVNFVPGGGGSAGGIIFNPPTLQGEGGQVGSLSYTNTVLNTNPAYNCSFDSNYVYTDAYGTRHSLPLFYYANNYQDACAYYGQVNPAENITTATDGTIGAVLGSDGAAYVYDLHGDQLNSQIGNGIEDSNGNYLDGSGRTYSDSNGVVKVPGLGAPYTYSSGASPGNFSFSTDISQIPGFTGISGDPCPAAPPAISGPVPGNTTIALPDGQKYTISYDPTYGLPSVITYPTGATVTYTWEINQNSEADVFLHINPNTPACGYLFGLPAVKSRVVSYDGVHPAEEQDFTYCTQWVSGGACGQWNNSSIPTMWALKTTTVVTKDLLRPGTPTFKTVYTYTPQEPFMPGWSYTYFPTYIPEENTIAYYDTQGNVLKTVTKVWSDNSDYTSYSQLLAECATLPDGKTSGTFYQYSGFSPLITDKAEYDYGAITTVCRQPTSAPMRETKTAYEQFGDSPLVPTTPIIQDRPASVTIYENGSETAQTKYGYDGASATGVAALNHDENIYGPGSTAPRGNLTSVTRVCLSGCSGNLVTSYTYDETGQLASAVDPNGNKTEYSYMDAYSADGAPPSNTNTYLTQVTEPEVNGVSHVTSYTYGWADGKMRSMTDENLRKTEYCYGSSGCSGGAEDPWARLTEIQYPDSGDTKIAYSDAGPNPYAITTRAISGSVALITKTVLDGFGHTIETQATSDPDGADTVDTTYDGTGNVHTVSNPYRGGSAELTTYTYDSLGRLTILQHPDGTSQQFCYNDIGSSGQTNCSRDLSSNPDVSWVDVSDEDGNHWQRGSDALGRLVDVMEPNGQQASGGAPTMETDYQYDALNDLLRVDQWGGASGSSSDRLRQFTYDSFGQLISATNPETGTIQYTYDPDRNLKTKTDARGIVRTYFYDALNRLTGDSFSKDTTGSPVSCYQYDTTSLAGGTNLVGRLTNEWTLASGSACGASPPAAGSCSSGAAYTPFGALESALYGNVILVNKGYDNYRMRFICESDSGQASGN